MSSDEEVGHYLSDSYRRDILGESVEVRVPAADPRLITNIKIHLAWIDSLRLGANLAQRDFVTYQHKRALEKLLKQLEAQRTSDAD
jgi:hypothetical protein